MTRVLGIDGGQSGIRLRHSSMDRVVEVDGVSRLEGDTIAAVAGAIARAWDACGSPSADRVVMGLSTAPTDTPSRERLCGTVGDATDIAEVWLADDSVTTHAGALSLGWGVSVFAGTGVACLAVPEQGVPRIIGGHGYLLGDEGGAFWIGREGLRAALRAGDGRGAQTALSAAAAARFDGLDDLGDRLHSARRPVNDIAQFAPDVLAIADDGDPVAGRIVDEATTELVLLVGAGATAVDPDGGPVAAAFGGRLLASGPTACGVGWTRGSRRSCRGSSAGPPMVRRSTGRSASAARGTPADIARSSISGAAPHDRHITARPRTARADSLGRATLSGDGGVAHQPSRRGRVAAYRRGRGAHGGCHRRRCCHPRVRQRAFAHARRGAVLPRRGPGAGTTDAVRRSDAPCQRAPWHGPRAAAGPCSRTRR